MMFEGMRRVCRSPFAKEISLVWVELPVTEMLIFPASNVKNLSLAYKTNQKVKILRIYGLKQ